MRGITARCGIFHLTGLTLPSSALFTDHLLARTCLPKLDNLTGKRERNVVSLLGLKNQAVSIPTSDGGRVSYFHPILQPKVSMALSARSAGRQTASFDSWPRGSASFSLSQTQWHCLDGCTEWQTCAILRNGYASLCRAAGGRAL